MADEGALPASRSSSSHRHTGQGFSPEVLYPSVLENEEPNTAQILSTDPFEKISGRYSRVIETKPSTGRTLELYFSWELHSDTNNNSALPKCCNGLTTSSIVPTTLMRPDHPQSPRWLLRLVQISSDGANSSHFTGEIPPHHHLLRLSWRDAAC